MNPLKRANRLLLIGTLMFAGAALLATSRPAWAYDDPTDKPPPDPAAATPAQRKRALLDLIKRGREAAQKVDAYGQQLLQLTPEEQAIMGREVNKLIRANFTVIDDKKAVRVLQDLAKPFIELGAGELEYTFTIIESKDAEDVNAFSHVGGYVYVNSGLWNLLENRAEMEFVLGHEIAHVELQHVTRDHTYTEAVRKLSGDKLAKLAGKAYSLMSVGYSQDQEFAADAWSYQAMRHLGYSKQDSLSALRRLKKYFDDHGMSDDREKPKDKIDKVKESVENHFRTHPPTAERITRLENLKVDP